MPFYNNHCCGFGACNNYNAYNTRNGCNTCHGYNTYNEYNNCNTCNSCNHPHHHHTTTYVGIPGPQGAVGPRGPQGPQGAMGSPGARDAIYANATAVTLTETTGLIPINLIRATTGTSMTVTGNTVILPAGTYLVTYNYNATATNTGNAILQLQLGNTAIDTITQAVTTNEAYTGSSTLLVTTTTDTPLGVYKADTNTITYNNVNLTVMKVQ